jgi:trigger factor
MECTVNDAGTLAKELIITVPAADVAAHEQRTLNSYANQVKMDGFRNGKTPMAVLKRRFGKHAKEQTNAELAQRNFQAAIKENDLKPLGPIDEKVEREGGALVCTFSFSITPDISLPDLSALPLEREDASVSADDVEAELNSMAKRMGEYADLPENATFEAEDLLTVKGTVTVDGEVIEELDDRSIPLGLYPFYGIATEDMLATFVGKSVGATLEKTQALPDNYKKEEFRGKDATVDVTVTGAKRTEAAPVDDAMAKRMGAESVEDLKTRLESHLQQQKTGAEEQRLAEAAQAALLEQVEVELPPKLLEDMAKNETEATTDEQREEANKSLKRFLILDAVATQNDIQADPQDLYQQLQMAAMQSGRKIDEIYQDLQESGRLQQVMAEIREQRTLEYVVTQAAGPAPGSEPAEADAAAPPEEAAAEAEA